MKIHITNLKTSFTIRVDDNGGGIISCNGRMWEVDEITIEILKRINSKLNIEEIVNQLYELYDVQKETLYSDIIDLLKEMFKLYLIDKNDLHAIGIDYEIN